MEKIIILGTGNAAVTKCYNTCFAIQNKEEYFLIDAGGGNGILTQLEKVNIPITKIHHMFVSHEHTDHVLGVVWMIRMICHELCHGNDLGDVRIYGHDEVLTLLREISEKLLQPKETAFFGNRLQFVEVTDGQTLEIIGCKMKFFDMGSTKAKQFGFVMELPDGQKLTCCGDEPYHEGLRPYAENSKWLLHEAFCLYNEREIFQPYEKHHSTVKDACELAQSLKISNLLLYHTEDGSFPNRKERYSQEGRQFYHQHLVIPDDLETIVL